MFIWFLGIIWFPRKFIMSRGGGRVANIVTRVALRSSRWLQSASYSGQIKEEKKSYSRVPNKLPSSHLWNFWKIWPKLLIFSTIIACLLDISAVISTPLSIPDLRVARFIPSSKEGMELTLIGHESFVFHHLRRLSLCFSSKWKKIRIGSDWFGM